MGQHPDIVELIEQSKNNNHASFRCLVLTHQNLVYSFAFRLLCDESDAKDVVQEVFIKVWQNLSKYNTDYKFTTWLYKICVNCCNDFFRSKKRQQHISLETISMINELAHGSSKPLYENKNLSETILFITQSLTPKQKLVFTLKELEGLDVNEIFMITGMTPEKIKSNLYLAKKNIRQQLKKIS